MIADATPGTWFVRKQERLGEVRDCFVAAPDCQGLPYDAEVLGEDEYREDTGMVRKLADCHLMAASKDLFAALQLARDNGMRGRLCDADIAIIDAAIAKAQGIEA